MDCRWCDWYLCRACLPVYRAKASSTWGMLMALPAYAVDKMLTDPSPAGFAERSRAASRRRDSRLTGCTPQEQAACALMSEFCEASLSSDCPHMPTETEFESLWMKCRMLPPWPVAEAICEQLSWVADIAWPPKLRAIHAIDRISRKGEEARELIDLISERAGPLLLQLTRVPQLKAKAVEVVNNLRANTAFSSYATMKSGDGESCALRIQARADTQDGNAHNSNMRLSNWAQIADSLGLPLPQWQLPSRCKQDWFSQFQFLDNALCFEPCQEEPSLVKTLRIGAPSHTDMKEKFAYKTLRIASPAPIRV